jgi:hypothetical protein
MSKPSYQGADEVIKDKQLDSWSAGTEDPPGNVFGMEGHFSFFFLGLIVASTGTIAI